MQVRAHAVFMGVCHAVAACRGLLLSAELLVRCVTQCGVGSVARCPTRKDPQRDGLRPCFNMPLPTTAATLPFAINTVNTHNT